MSKLTYGQDTPFGVYIEPDAPKESVQRPTPSHTSAPISPSGGNGCSEKLHEGPTPRTDAEEIVVAKITGLAGYVRAKFASELEMKLAEANDLRDTWERHAADLQARAAELDAAQSASGDIRHRHEIIMDNVRLRKALIDIQAAFGEASSCQHACDMAEIASAALARTSEKVER